MTLPDFGNEGRVRAQFCQHFAELGEVYFPLADLQAFAVHTGGVHDVQVSANWRKNFHIFVKRTLAVVGC